MKNGGQGSFSELTVTYLFFPAHQSALIEKGDVLSPATVWLKMGRLAESLNADLRAI